MLERQNEIDAQHAEEFEKMHMLETEVDEKVQDAIRHAEMEI